MAKAMDDSAEGQEPASEVSKEGPADNEDPGQVLMELGDDMASAFEKIGPQMPKQIQAQMSGIMGAFGQMVEGLAGGGPATEPAGQGQVAMNQGMSGVPMGPQTRQ